METASKEAPDAAPGETPQRDEPAALEEDAAAEQPLPEWLTADFLRDALASDPAAADTPALRVTGFHAEPAVGKGDNYASSMLRVRVDVAGAAGDGSRSVIVKSLPVADMTRTWVERMQLFPKEARMYKETLPRMQELLQQRLGGRPFARLAARAFATSVPSVMVFEDLREQGFKMAKRQCGLDLEHCLMVMRALGTLHALSIAMHEEDPESVNYKESLYTEEACVEFELWMPKTFDTLAKTVENWPGFETYADRLRSFGKTILKATMNMLKDSEDRFRVLNHADCWVNNMLFKYSDTTGRPEDIRFVDFQVCRYTSMAFDLHYFLFSSPMPEIRTDKMDEMLLEYHTTLQQVMRDLGCRRPAVSWEELQEEMRRTLPFGVLSATNLLAIVVAEPSEALVTEGVTEEDVKSGEVDIFDKTLKGKTFASALRLLLPYFDQQGVL